METTNILSTSTTLFPTHTATSSYSSTSLSSIPKVRISRQRIRTTNSNNRNLLRVQSRSAAMAIEKERPESERPDTFLRDADEAASAKSIRSRFEKMIREAQDSICQAIERADGVGKFKEDVWSRPGGGGGISRVLQDGGVWEKAGVNVSVVYGTMPPEAYRAAKGDNSATKAGPVPFFAAGISSVLHPKNPFAPTLHFNYRYFETDAPKGIIVLNGLVSHLIGFPHIRTRRFQTKGKNALRDLDGAPRQWWFGGGTDLTPAYIFEEDVKHFHTVQKKACDKFDPEFYPKFKKWCDDYFVIKHRDERRGLGGIFFDDLNGYDQEMLLSFATECASSVIPAYIPIIERRKDMPFTDQHKAWQQLRRGRYIEFNLVYDRGTTFGLKTGGRIESILVSLPLTARWEYDH
ncbi:hypothetical protein AQUCO_03000291v1 [Aquilegia coerulea]|nr:hypothetical protein AQUCO_03000291v1 [Aquilegia coerulea]